MTTKTTSRQVLTTPFVQPAACSGIFSSTIISYRSIQSRNTTTIIASIAVSTGSNNETNSLFTNCHPSGWDYGYSRFTFSPAVCPRSWTAYDVGPSARYNTLIPATTTAICCASGYSYDALYIRVLKSTLYGDGRFCISSAVSAATPTAQPGLTPTITSSQTPTAAASQTLSTSIETLVGPTATEQLYIHYPYFIQWKESDRTSLSPLPPSFPCYTSLSTWKPQDVVNISCPTATSTSSDTGGGSVLPPLWWLSFLVMGVGGAGIYFLFVMLIRKRRLALRPILPGQEKESWFSRRFRFKKILEPSNANELSLIQSAPPISPRPSSNTRRNATETDNLTQPQDTSPPPTPPTPPTAGGLGEEQREVAHIPNTEDADDIPPPPYSKTTVPSY